MLRTVRPILVIRMNDGFGVAVGIESVTKLFELLAQLQVVIDFPIEDNPRRAVGIVDWLMAGLQVNNGQTAHAETDRPIDVETVVVRSSMTDSFAHLVEQTAINVHSVTSYYSNNSTHIETTLEELIF